LKVCPACEEELVFEVCDCGATDVARAVAMAEKVLLQLVETRRVLLDRLERLEKVAGIK
jgi:hypothetical protein